MENVGSNALKLGCFEKKYCFLNKTIKQRSCVDRHEIIFKLGGLRSCVICGSYRVTPFLEHFHADDNQKSIVLVTIISGIEPDKLH